MTSIYVARNSRGFVYVDSASANDMDCKIKALRAMYAQRDIDALGLDKAFEAHSLEIVELVVPERSKDSN